MFNLMPKFGGEIGIAIDIGVSLTVIGGMVTFWVARHEETQRRKRHRSWDAFSNYTQVVLCEVLKRRDNYTDVFLDLCRRKNDGSGALLITGKDVQNLISEAESTNNFVKISLQRAYDNYKSKDDGVNDRAKAYSKLCVELSSGLAKWSADAVGLITNEPNVLAHYSGDHEKLLIHPAGLITDFYLEVASNFEEI